jgi:hypothetical protein
VTWLSSLPADALWYDAALFLLACAFFIYAIILRHLLALIGRKGFWVLPLLGSILLVAAALIHGFAAVQLSPLIPIDPEIYKESMRLRSLSLLCLLGCGALSALAGWLYYHSMGE